MLLFWAVIVFPILDYTLRAKRRCCCWARLLPEGWGDAGRARRQVLEREVWRNSWFCGSELLCSTWPGDNHGYRTGMAVVTLPHGGQPAGRKVLGLDIRGCWEAEVCSNPYKGTEKTSLPPHQASMSSLSSFGVLLVIPEVTLTPPVYELRGSVSSEVKMRRCSACCQSTLLGLFPPFHPFLFPL